MSLAARGKRGSLARTGEGIKEGPDFQGILIERKFGKLLVEVLEFGQSRRGCSSSV